MGYEINISLASPVTGEVVEVNPGMASAPENINQDPFGAGWLAVIRVTDWQADKPRLLDAQTYFARMKLQAEQEVAKS